jgi:DNA sulfur modification protein DndE
MWHQINIHTSGKNKEVVQKLTRKLPTGTKENVIARLALGYSLQTGKKFSKPEFNEYDSKGKEYKDHILFDARYRDLSIALICQHYEVYRTHEDIPKYVKLHVDHGLEMINQLFEDNQNFTFFDFLQEYLDRGISYLEDTTVSNSAVRNTNQNIDKSYFVEPILIEVGNPIDDGQDNPITMELNNITLRSNAHIAVAGKSGSGKTQFILSFLSRLHKASNGQVNYLFLDFKGLKQGDIEVMQPFFTRTQCEFIDAPHKPFPFNPLSFIDNINEKDKLMGINKFVDIIAKYSNIGKRQEQELKHATKEAFHDMTGGEYPTLNLIYEKVLEVYGDKRDTLTEILEGLSELDIFQKNHSNSFLLKNHYFSLSGDLPNAIRFTSVFLIINYVYNIFMNMENTPVENNYKGIRYALVIDEAHVIFKDKKAQDLLDSMLREIRSKGVSVILLSQGISEFTQPGTEFSSNCDNAFLLDINDKGNSKAISKFLGLSDREGIKAARSIEKIKTGMAISNIGEFEKGSLFTLNQIHKDEI